MTARRSSLTSPSRMTIPELLRQEMKPLAGQKVLVIGDLILDHYLWGSVERTCYEAPVPVLRHERDSWVLGAAGNVANNIASLGGRALMVGVVGHDGDGERLINLLKNSAIDTTGVARLEGRPTSVKTRVSSQGQQMLRIDNEDTSPLSAAAEKKVIQSIARLAPSCRMIIVSDYAKGVVTDGVIKAALGAAKKAGARVLVDPKGRDYRKYRGADVVKPNDREVALAVGRSVGNEEELLAAGRELIRRCGMKSLIISRGPEGMAVLEARRKPRMIPARAREVFDVTGAGDTVVATLALGLAVGLSLADAATLANHAAGVVVAKLGVSTVSPEELREAISGRNGAYKVRPVDELRILLTNLQSTGRKVVFTNGCFDLLHPGHIYFLHEAKRLGDVLVVGLNTDRSVRALKGAPRPILPQSERAAILSALQVVDYIVFFDELTPEDLLEKLRPDILVKGRNIPEDQVVGREIVKRYGGKVRRLPILHSSTVTDMVDAIVGKFEKNKA